ncbi:MAG: InlB B-repeat-containing protein, partial [Coriobacteriia bacterium]|nr:InlB B-repeat-containing protein [Coriobacteriia bacterium]
TATAAPGYTFSHWTTTLPTDATDLSERTVAPQKNGGVYQTVTYTAIFEARSDILVTFNANGGTDAQPADKYVTFDSPYGELAYTNRADYMFIGWFTEADGGTEVTAATIVKNADDHTLYAHWRLVEVPTQFDKTADQAGYTFDTSGNIVTFKINCMLPKDEGLETWDSIRIVDMFPSDKLTLIGLAVSYGGSTPTTIPMTGLVSDGELSVSFDAADLAPYADMLLTLTLTFEVTAGTVGSIKNNAAYYITPKGGEEPGDPGEEDDDDVYEFIPVVDFTKTYGNTFIGNGDDIDFTVSFTLPADTRGYAGLLLVDFLPATLSFKSASVVIDGEATTSVTPAHNSGRVSIYLDAEALADLAGSVVVLNITATVNDVWESGNITNLARIYYQLDKNTPPVIDDDPDEEIEVTVPNREFSVTYFANNVLATGSAPVDTESPYIRDAWVTILESGSLALVGYNFIGWAYDPSATTPDFALDGGAFDPAGFEITESTELYAVWQARSDILVTFNANGGTAAAPASKEVTYDAAYGTLATTTRVGYVFNGWFTSATGGTQVTTATIVKNADDHTLYAQWTAIPYTVSVVNSYAATTGAGTYNIGNTVTIAAGTRAGYTFTGWTVNAGGASLASNAATTSFTMPAANVTVTANWAAVLPAAEVTYTVTFVDFDGTVLSTQTVTPGASAVAPADPTRDGFIFTGWDTDFTNVQSDLTVTAQYATETFTVTFVDSEGNVISEQSVPRGGDAVEPMPPALEGFDFTGWDTDFTNVQSDLTVRPLYVINEVETPLIGAYDSWALVNFILMLIGALMAVVVVIRTLFYKRKDEDEETSQTEQTERQPLWIGLTIFLAIAGIVFFFLTENMRNPMILVDRWTIYSAIIFVIELVTTLFAFKRETSQDESQEVAAA